MASWVEKVRAWPAMLALALGGRAGAGSGAAATGAGAGAGAAAGLTGADAVAGAGAGAGAVAQAASVAATAAAALQRAGPRRKEKGMPIRGFMLRSGSERIGLRARRSDDDYFSVILKNAVP
ncbi:hypothetical protein GCM10023165_31760 [Variovorax defluvii]|uniref:Uncharacterized protein n=1 Tax=Variovorax defluvii TaxID=913761 RepID=A0ABP8HXR0_9BURK